MLQGMRSPAERPAGISGAREKPWPSLPVREERKGTEEPGKGYRGGPRTAPGPVLLIRACAQRGGHPAVISGPEDGVAVLPGQISEQSVRFKRGETGGRPGGAWGLTRGPQCTSSTAPGWPQSPQKHLLPPPGQPNRMRI